MNATPQLEHGFVRIANGVFKSLARIKLGSYHSRILFVIFLKTYGFNKKEDWVSNSQFVLGTGISASHVSRTIKELIEMNIVTKGGNKVSFQKDSRLWKELPKGARSHHVTKGGNSVTKGGNSKLPKGAYTIDTLTKDTIQKTIISKDITKPIGFDSRKVGMDVFASKGNAAVSTIITRLEQHLGGKLDGSVRNNRNFASHLLKKYTHDQIEAIFKALPLSKFWAGKITSTQSLYNHASQIINSLQDQGGKFADLSYVN